MRAPSGLAVLFGKKKDEAEEDAPTDEDISKAHSDAFDAFFDAVHAKDREGARRAWKAMNGEDSEEPDGDERMPDESDKGGE